MLLVQKAMEEKKDGGEGVIQLDKEAIESMF